MKFSVEDFFSKCDQIRDLVTFTEEIWKTSFFVQWREIINIIKPINVIVFRCCCRFKNCYLQHDLRIYAEFKPSIFHSETFFLIEYSFRFFLKPKMLKSALSGLRQFLAIERPLKMMKNAFYITSKALFVLKIFKYLTFWSCSKTV